MDTSLSLELQSLSIEETILKLIYDKIKIRVQYAAGFAQWRSVKCKGVTQNVSPHSMALAEPHG